MISLSSGPNNGATCENVAVNRAEEALREALTAHQRSDEFPNRCRCGIRYAELPDCPAVEAAYQQLSAARGNSTPAFASTRSQTEPETLVQPCRMNPDAYDIDLAKPEALLRSRNACWSCPLLDKCHDALEQLYPHAAGGKGPIGMVWAGTIWSDSGNAMTDREVRALKRTNHKSESTEGFAA